MLEYANYYYLVLVSQAFCIYHAYKNNNQQKWYWLIIFLPIVGCLIYLYNNFNSQRNISIIAEGGKGLVYTNLAVEKLEKEVQYSETVTNKMNLADAYTERGRFDEAMGLYESCQKGFYENNPDLLRKLLKVHYLRKEYDKVVALGERLETVKSVGDSEDKIAYAWALYYTGEPEKAEAKFITLDARYANFYARFEFARFYIETGRSPKAKQVLNNIIEEYDGMDKYEQDQKKPIQREAKRMLLTIK
jgi:hypothetical protein